MNNAAAAAPGVMCTAPAEPGDEPGSAGGKRISIFEDARHPKPEDRTSHLRAWTLIAVAAIFLQAACTKVLEPPLVSPNVLRGVQAVGLAKVQWTDDVGKSADLIMAE